MPVALVNRSDVSAASETADTLIPFLGQSQDIANENWWVELCEQWDGAQEEKCTIRLQAVENDEDAYTLALNPNGPASYLQHGETVVVKRRWTNSKGRTGYELLFAGMITKVKHIGALDALQIEALSFKEKLRDVKIVGSWCWDGTNLVYRRGVDLRMNQGGRPDWTFTPDGIPVPAPHADWGLADDETPPLPTDKNSAKVTNCTFGMFLEYLRIFHGPMLPLGGKFGTGWTRAVGDYPDLVNFRCPDYFVWPDSFGALLDFENVSNFNQGIGQGNQIIGGARKGRDMSFGGGIGLIGSQGVPGVLDSVFEAAGGWSYALDVIDDPENGFLVVLGEVPQRPTAAFDAVKMYYATGPASTAYAFPVIMDPEYEEDSAEVATRALGLGSRIKNEQRFITVLPAWTAEEFSECMTEAVLLGGTKPTPTTFRQALGLYPNVGGRFIVPPSTNPGQGSDYAAFLQTQQPRPILGSLLSFQGAETTDQANDIVHFPVRVEVQISGVWQLASEKLGMIVWENGIIEFPAFREFGIDYNDTRPAVLQISETNGVYNVSGGAVVCSINAIRFTAAMELDQCLETGIVSPFDENPGADRYNLDDQSPDAGKFAQQFTRPIVVDAKGLYEYWNRTDTSFPDPESVGGVAFGKKILRDDTLLLAAHTKKALRHCDRLKRNGPWIMKGWLCNVYGIGTVIGQLAPVDGSIDPFDVNCVIRGRRWLTLRSMNGEQVVFENRTEHYIV